MQALLSAQRTHQATRGARRTTTRQGSHRPAPPRARPPTCSTSGAHQYSVPTADGALLICEPLSVMRVEDSATGTLMPQSARHTCGRARSRARWCA